MLRFIGRRLGARPTTGHALSLGALVLLAACGEAPTKAISADPLDASIATSVPAQKGPGGNSLNAKACQKNGWQGLVTSTGATFENEGACVSYGANGGTLYKSQTITFGALAGKTFGDAGFAVSATASSALPVTFAASGTCTVSGSTVTLTGAGTCTITASQSGDATWFAAPDVAQSFAVAKGSQTVTFTSANPLNVTVGATYTPTATASSALTVSLTLDAASTGCTLASGVVTFTAAGTCVINANQAGDGNWNPAAQQQQSVVSVKANQTVMFTSANPSPANVGATYTPTATATSGLVVAFAVAPGSTGCTIADGVVTFTSAGTCLVSATQAGSIGYNAAPAVQQSITTRIPCIDSDGTLRAAAAAGGTYTFCTQEATVLLTGGQITVGTTLTLNAVGTGNAVINAQTLSRVFSVTQFGNLTLQNVTVTNGRDAAGGGIYIIGSVTLRGNSAVSGNGAAQGGGVFIVGDFRIQGNSGLLTMNDASTVANNGSSSFPNSSTVGGGVYLDNNARLTMNGTSAVRNNVVTGLGSGGGGVASNSGTVRMNDQSAITGNSAVNLKAGGLYNVNRAALFLTGSARITGNSANDGGGIYYTSGTITGVTAANVKDNTPNNCAGPNPVPGCINP